MPEDENNSWNDVLGPFYAESGLVSHGVDESEGLIGLTTEDGEVIYPHAQFDVLHDQTLKRREIVINLWNNLIRPAIDEGIIDEWTATGLLLQETEDSPSKAELLSRDEAQVGHVAQDISRALRRFRQ